MRLARETDFANEIDSSGTPRDKLRRRPIAALKLSHKILPPSLLNVQIAFEIDILQRFCLRDDGCHCGYEKVSAVRFVVYHEAVEITPCTLHDVCR
jgi:hypothetical protein